jgi:hypothetical protein
MDPLLHHLDPKVRSTNQLDSPIHATVHVLQSISHFLDFARYFLSFVEHYSDSVILATVP